MTPRPFLKWAGGKGQLLGALRERVPSFKRYFEPFLGGGALFFALQPKRGVLSDVNDEIINCYKVVRDDVTALIGALGDHRYDEDHYYEVRNTDPATLPPIERAARTIFLNKTGFNGLYRVNRSGKFNVPFGRYAKPAICDQENLRACSEALGDMDIKTSDFEHSAGRAEGGDFVYFDPPYVPVSRTAAFTAYAPGGFGLDAQSRLARLFAKLAGRGVKVLLSNSDVPEIRELYASFRIETIPATRTINCKATRRGPVSELLVRNLDVTVAAPERKSRRAPSSSRTTSGRAPSSRTSRQTSAAKVRAAS
ncbi:MAG: DNA adenine methylase, partial [Polyangiaceae bacterium]